MSASDERILVLAPRGRDGDVATRVLAAGGLEALACLDLAALCARLDEGAGGVLLTEEALTVDGLDRFLDWIDRQPIWSDLPVVVLASKRVGPRPGRAAEILDHLGNVILLERPINAETLLSAARSAIRGRRRQYQARTMLEAEERAATDLRHLNETLEQRVAERTAERDRMWRLSSDLMDVCNIEGRLLAVNHAWTAMLGWTEPELLALNFLDLVHPDDIAPTLAEMRKLEDGAMTLRFENRFRSRDGAYRQISWTASPEAGNFYAIGRDITEQRATEDALRQSQKMEAIGQLTGGIAHDFNNMLAGVVGSLDLMRRRIAANEMERVPRYLDAAMTSAQRAAGLTARLLAFGRRQSLDLKATDVNGVVAGLEELMRRTLGENVLVETRLAPDLWPSRTDANQLESAMLNLAINARDAMPEGGRLTVATRNRTFGATEARQLEGLAPGDYIQIDVADTGIGMSAQTLKKVFEPFFTTKPVGQGTGLGLSMIYGFAKQSNGHVTVKSREGEGTVMSLVLPRFAEPAEAIEDGEDMQAPKGDGETVLVVEDEALVRMLVVDVLEDLGYRAIEAASADEAIPYLKGDGRIDLLMTDVGLPGMNGRQLAEVARSVRPELKILFVTGYAEKAAVRGDFLGDRMDIVTKPFVFESLATKIREMIEGDASAA
ncbi:hypothetical protein ASG43_03080 [Aureimonas sp. Leaf454]|uniref:ATP-binding protein n=1 Tax=Aureimonas sp. Leaf454 TaxID=1736381 RepID=UPI0007021859|nr:PAS domain-containing sensor histidine kinase [Aureimonas sp. Leaf454]KQT54582.1 hypothetical protein ASG43_03080 [Aureimonas sp. Leaf454]